jgi:hypothetical protein
VRKVKEKNKPLEMVLNGQQWVQSFYIAIHGSHEGGRLYFDVTSGPVTSTDDEDDGESGTYRFVFWRDQEPSRPKRHVLVSEIMSWGQDLRSSRSHDLSMRFRCAAWTLLPQLSTCGAFGR